VSANGRGLTGEQVSAMYASTFSDIIALPAKDSAPVPRRIFAPAH
jgi:hypothetical protein